MGGEEWVEGWVEEDQEVVGPRGVHKVTPVEGILGLPTIGRKVAIVSTRDYRSSLLLPSFLNFLGVNNCLGEKYKYYHAFKISLQSAGWKILASLCYLIF